MNDNNLNYSDFKIDKKKLIFKINDFDKLELILFSKKDNLINPYIDQYRSFELDYKKLNDNYVEVSLSKFGILTINNAALKQSIEIVRRRIDDVGTKEPTIFKEERKNFSRITWFKRSRKNKKTFRQNSTIEF